MVSIGFCCRVSEAIFERRKEVPEHGGHAEGRPGRVLRAAENRLLLSLIRVSLRAHHSHLPTEMQPYVVVVKAAI